MKSIFLLMSSISCLVVSSLFTSCGGCCTGTEAVPPLRPAPNFSSEPVVTPVPPVYYQK